ncbi:unnamed protein product [Acanthoscelides obtectus]|uniref:THAP-type domain-containing protein n=1 Tax=Acanthoscelides obtectus TaxID=200917 RepID=A0A9P0Q3U2_ACAOB|nr:unnamed protein product [Acanthoscelides obtectus]CAK1641575.1 Transposable element P transposase [Acanthoscelides obtectus]
MSWYRKCAVRGCQDSVSVRHRFPNPTKFMYVFVQWVDCIGNEVVRDIDPITVYNRYRVCHAHFTVEDNYGNNRLRKDAVPSLNLPDQQISNATDEILGSSRTESGLLHKLHVTRETHLSPKAKKLYKIASHLSRANRRLRCTRRLIRSTREVLNEALHHLDSTVATFIKSQITLAGSKSQGRRYSLEDKLMGLILHKQSGRGYPALSKIFALPSKKTIMQLLNRIPINPGVNDVIFNNLAEVVSGLDESSKYCAVMFDEMSLDPHIHLNVATKEFEGFETNDDEQRSAVIADHALVFMVRGLVKNWKQPLAYTFCRSSTKIPSASEDPTRKYLFLNGVKIIHIYDPPHLIKGIRNNLLTENLVWESAEDKYVASWQNIETAYAIDNAAGSLRAMPKLTECHVNRNCIKKMKVSYATQVFSHTVASVMTLMARAGIVGIQGEKLSETAQGTAKVLKFFDDLMDSVNGYSLYPSNGKPLRSAVSRCTDHFEFWVEARQTLRKMYYQGFYTTFYALFSNNNQTAAEGTEEQLRPPSLVNWTVTINGIIDIFEMLEQGNVNHLKCRRLNQDPIENFFGQIRQQGLRDTNPTCSHFKNHFKTLLINNFSSRHSMSANCESENSKNYIVAVKKFITVDVVVPSSTDFCSFPSETPNFALQYIK